MIATTIPEPKKEPPVLSLAKMARRLNVSRKWLKDEAEAGRVPALKAGRQFLFEPEAVEKALAERAAAATWQAEAAR